MYPAHPSAYELLQKHRMREPRLVDQGHLLPISFGWQSGRIGERKHVISAAVGVRVSPEGEGHQTLSHDQR